MRSSAIRFSVLAALALTASALAWTSPTALADEPAEGLHVPLQGPWRFIMDDDPAFADPAFDDSDWEFRTAPVEGGQDDFDFTNGLAWFRRTFHLPDTATGADLFLSMGVVDDADEIYVNGTLVAGSGVIGDPPVTAFFWPRLYDVDEAPFAFGATNTIAVRVSDTGGGGGITAGPLAVLTRDQVAEVVFERPFETAPADLALATLQAQTVALAAGDLDAYAATLAADHHHQGHDRARRLARIADLIATHGAVTRTDEIVRAGVDPSGALVVEVRRRWLTPEGDELPDTRGVVRAPLDGPDQDLEFLVFDPSTGQEVGDHARFFRDVVHSEVSAAVREFDVYLPPSYFEDPERRYPSVYLFHGAGGNNKEWEIKELDRRLDELVAGGFISEMIVIAVDGKSPGGVNTWYANSSEEQWRTMFFDELRPQVDATFRTIDDRRARGTAGWSMGGQGAFTIAWEAPELFGSISSLSGALSFPPLVGSPAELAANAALAPVVMVNTLTPQTLASYCYYLYAGEDDDFAFDDAARAMQAELATRLVTVEAEIKASPAAHVDHVQLPGLQPAFILQSLAFDSHGEDGCSARIGPNQVPVATDDSVAVDGTTPTVTVDVLANDADPDGDRLRFGAVDPDASSAGRVVDGGDGRLVVDVDGLTEELVTTYEVLDGRGATATATLRIQPAAAPTATTSPTPAGPTSSPELPATGAAGAGIFVVVLGWLGVAVRRLRRSGEPTVGLSAPHQ